MYNRNMLTGDRTAAVRKNHHTYSDSSPIEAQARICLKHCNADFCTLSSIVNFRACFNSLNLWKLLGNKPTLSDDVWALSMPLVWTVSHMGIGIVVRMIITSVSLPTEINTSWMQWDGRCLDVLHPAQTYCYGIFHFSSLLKKTLRVLCSHWTMTCEMLWVYWFRQQPYKLVRLVVSACTSVGHLSKCLWWFFLLQCFYPRIFSYALQRYWLYTCYSGYSLLEKVRGSCTIMEKCPQWVWKFGNLLDTYTPTHNTNSSTSRRNKFWSHCDNSTKQGKKLALKILSSLLD